MVLSCMYVGAKVRIDILSQSIILKGEKPEWSMAKYNNMVCLSLLFQDRNLKVKTTLALSTSVRQHTNHTSNSGKSFLCSWTVF